MSASAGDAAAPALRSRPLLHYKDLGLSTQNRKVLFTCVHASENFLACGSNTGSVYLYATSVLSRNEHDSRVSLAKYHLVKMITPPSNDRVPVACLSICPQQKRLVVGTKRGVVYALQLAEYHKIGEKIEFSHDFHKGFPITCFLWDKRGARLFSACNAGLVCQTVLRAGMSALFGSTDTELLLKEETGIVQLDLARSGSSQILMVSSQLRVLLLNLSSEHESAVQIGTKARQGAYGACFFTSLNVESIDPTKKREIKVFSSRPGRRVWVADPQSGTVSSTLKFSLTKSPTLFLQSPKCAIEEEIQPRDLSINKLGRFQFLQGPSYAPQDVRDATTLLVSWNAGSRVLFFLDPLGVEIVEWHLDLGIIHDLTIVNETTLAVLHGDAPKVSLIQSCSADQFLQIYGSDDVKKAVELAVEFNFNDAAVVTSLHTQWLAHLDNVSTRPVEYDELTKSLKALVDQTKALEEKYRMAVQGGLSATNDLELEPLQVIYKQRPQQVVAVVTAASSDLCSGQEEPRDAEVTLTTGSALHKPIEYFDVLAPATPSYSKSVCTPDGSFLEARLMNIPVLPPTSSVLEDDFRESYMEEIMEEVKRSEQMRSEEGARNMSLLPTIRDGSTAAVKAFSTYIPGTSMLTHLMDGSRIPVSFGRSDASGLFSAFPEFDNDELTIDPDPRLLQARYTHGYNLDADANEYSVLRIAMSTIGEADESNVDTEVLLEAISMDIWDSDLKYTSNLPIGEQLDLPQNTEDGKHMNGRILAGRDAHANRCADDAKRGRDVSPRAEGSDLLENLHVQMPILAAPSNNDCTPIDKSSQLLEHRSLASTDEVCAAQRAIQKYFGAPSSCEVKIRCIVGGRMAVSSELEPTVRRDISELTSELHAASATAEKTKHLTRRLWPASGITRVCACLTSVYLLQGDMAHVQTTIKAWLSCFDPTAQHAEADDCMEDKNVRPNKVVTTGFARGEALVDGDGLPLTRGDWNLVRALVSIYFAVWAAGSKLHLHPVSPKAQAGGKVCRLYESEMGITLVLEPRYNWDNEVEDSLTNSATADEAEAFVTKYGVYINPELAAEVCNLRRFTGALTTVLDGVVSSADMADIYNEIVGWISEKEIDKAVSALKKHDSLCLLLDLLDILLKKCPQETIDICVCKYPVLYPWNVERALFGTELDWEAIVGGLDGTREMLLPNAVAQTSTYLRYLVRLLEKRGDEAGKDAQVVRRCLDLCFASNAVLGDLFDHNERHGRLEWIAAVVRQPDRYVYDHAECWDMFTKYNALLPLLELTMLSLQGGCDVTMFDRGVTELRALVALMAECKDLLAFEKLVGRVAGLPHNSEQCLCDVLNQIQGYVSNENRHEPLCSAAVHALLNSVNLDVGMRLLGRFPSLFSTIPLQTYCTIVETHVLTERQKHEVVRMLEIVDSNVWASYKEDVSATSSVSFAPQLAAILQLEMDALVPALNQEQYEMWESNCKQCDNGRASHRLREVDDVGINNTRLLRTFGNDQNSEKSRTASGTVPMACRSFEYRNSDWGDEVQLHDSTCAACELPVVIVQDDNRSLDVVLLPCGHAFHDDCLDDKSCPTCLEANLETLNWC